MDTKEEIKPLAIYTSEETAQILGLSVISIQRYVRRGLIKATALGKGYRITGQAILDFLEENRKVLDTQNSEK